MKSKLERKLIVKTAFLLLFVSSIAFAHESPKVQDPNTTLYKWGKLLSVQDINLSIRTLNTLEMSHQFFSTPKFEIKSDGWMNVSNREFQNTLQIVLRFK
jgi:hypothetical protein